MQTAHLSALEVASREQGEMAETHGDANAELAKAGKVIEAAYDAPYLAHAQLEPPSALARFNQDGTLDLWLPNQGPEMYQAVSAEIAGIKPEQVRVHSPPVGGFFGRHWLYGSADPFREAIPLARAAGRPVIVSGVGGMAEAVAHGVDGLHVPPGDVAALAETMRAAADPDLWSRLAAEARPANHAAFVGAHLDLYVSLLERAPA